MTTKTKATKYIRLKLLTIKTDPVTYKPYDPTFTPEVNLFVEIPIEDGVISQDKEDTVLTLEGFQCLLKNLANAIDEADASRQAARQATYNRRR